MKREELEKTVTAFLDLFTTVTLACTIRDEPWTAAVFYARREYELIFFSSPLSRHGTVFAENPRAAAAVHGTYDDWKDIKGLQMSGVVQRISGARAYASSLAVYLGRFPFVRQFLKEPATVSRNVAGVALYTFQPAVIRYTDNELGFGRRWQLTIEKGRAVGEPFHEVEPDQLGM
jgi:hypothetical protein